jgi:hypothetical protein
MGIAIVHGDCYASPPPAAMLLEYIESTITKFLEPVTLVLRYFRIRSALLANPRLVIEPPDEYSKSFKNPIGFSVSIIAHQWLIANAILMALAFIMDRGEIDEIKELSTAHAQWHVVAVPCMLVLSAYLFRGSLRGASDSRAADESHVLYLIYLCSLLFWPYLLIGVAEDILALSVRNRAGELDALMLPFLIIGFIWLFIVLKRRSAQLRATFSNTTQNILIALFVSNILTNVVFAFIYRAICSPDN